MAKVKYILSLFALVLAGCTSTQPLCIDDAYHWEDKTYKVSTSQTSTTSQSSSTTPSTPNTPNTQTNQTPETPAPSSPTLEYVNVQDTSITVRINR